MKLKIPLFLFIVSNACLGLLGQDTLSVQMWSGLSLKTNSTGGLGSSTQAGIEFPTASSKYPVRRLVFWLTGINGNGDTVAVPVDVFGTATNWAEGPMGTAPRLHVKPAEWPRLFSVSKQEIDYHKLNYKSGTYTMPKGIAQWPGNFALSGFPTILAAYVDDNQSGSYDPMNGDFPYVPGMENVLAMGSDSAALSSLKTHQTALDMTALWFEPSKNDSIPNTVYFRLTTCNRNNDTLRGLKISAVVDFAIGSTIDDQLATHVSYNTVYAYNQPGSDAVYGANWPVVAVGWLSRKASSCIYMFDDNSTVQGNPKTEREFFYYANGFWRTGANMGSSGSGLDASTSTSKFVYPGTTDPALPKNRNWTNSEGGAGRQTAILSTEAITLGGKTCKVTDGYISIIPNAPDSATIEKRFAQITKHYNSQSYTLQNRPWPTQKAAMVFPNPASQGAGLNLPGSEGKTLTITDFAGRVLVNEIVKNNAWRVTLSQGNYIVSVGNEKPLVLVIK